MIKTYTIFFESSVKKGILSSVSTKNIERKMIKELKNMRIWAIFYLLWL